jgi:hypothetical protein
MERIVFRLLSVAVLLLVVFGTVACGKGGD